MLMGLRIIMCLALLLPGIAHAEDRPSGRPDDERPCREVAGVKMCGIDVMAAVRAVPYPGKKDDQRYAQAQQSSPLPRLKDTTILTRRDRSRYGFIRTGYIHKAGRLSSAEAAILLDEEQVAGGPLLVAGLNQPIWSPRRAMLSLEGEVATTFDYAEECIAGSNPSSCIETGVSNTAFLISTRAEFLPRWRVRPFVSAGLGPVFSWSRAQASFDGVDNTDTNSEWGIAYQGRAGIIARLGKQFTAEMGYRYMGGDVGVGDIEFEAAELGFVVTY